MFRIKTKQSKRIDTLINKLIDKKITLGFYSSATYPDNTPVVEVARINNYGGRQGNAYIPPRPFLTSLPFHKKQHWVEFSEDVKDKYFHDNQIPTLQGFVDHLMINLANEALSNLQDHIRDYSWKPNAPLTIQKKGSSRPLVDTKFLIKVATYKIITI